MPSMRTLLLGLLGAITITPAEPLRVVFSSGSFSTISGPAGGNTNGHYNGFAIINDAGDAIYDQGTPNGHVPCYNTNGGRTFTIAGDCWTAPRTFHCLADFGGSPESCEVRDGEGNVLGTADGTSDTTFIGIAIGIDASCVVEFESEDAESGACPVDDGSGPLHVTSG